MSVMTPFLRVIMPSLQRPHIYDTAVLCTSLPDVDLAEVLDPFYARLVPDPMRAHAVPMRTEDG